MKALPRTATPDEPQIPAATPDGAAPPRPPMRSRAGPTTRSPRATPGCPDALPALPHHQSPRTAPRPPGGPCPAAVPEHRARLGLGGTVAPWSLVQGRPIEAIGWELCWPMGKCRMTVQLAPWTSVPGPVVVLGAVPASGGRIYKVHKLALTGLRVAGSVRTAVGPEVGRHYRALRRDGQALAGECGSGNARCPEKMPI